MGSMKRKLPMKKIEKKELRAVAFSKRRTGLYSKASKLCRLSGAQMAILMTPSSSNSHASLYSFGHSSVDGVVAAFLDGQRPVLEDTLGSGLWWEEEDLAASENPEELRGARDFTRPRQSIRSLLMISEMEDVPMVMTNTNMCSDSQGVEDGGVVLQRCLDEENRLF